MTRTKEGMRFKVLKRIKTTENPKVVRDALVQVTNAASHQLLCPISEVERSKSMQCRNRKEAKKTTKKP